MAVEWHFPTPIFVHNFEGEQLDCIQTEIATALPSILRKIHSSPWGDNVNTTFERDGKNDIEDHKLEIFSSAIAAAVDSYTTTIGYPKTQFHMIESWFNICKKNQFQYDHTHSTARISGCYYFKTSGEDGRIRFANPNPIIHIGRFPADQIEIEAITYAPKVGRLLLFPGWLTHRVNVNNSENERISVSFNFS
jgi:uncharacterized protein (TIGR02466 family)